MDLRISKNDYTPNGNSFLSELFFINNFNCKQLNVTYHRLQDSTGRSPLVDQLIKSGFKIVYQEKGSITLLHNKQLTNCVIRIHTTDFESDIATCGINLYDAGDLKQSFLDKVEQIISPYKYKEGKKKNKINFIVKMEHGLELMEKEVKKVKVPQDNYEMSFSFDEIDNLITGNDNGLILFNGPPGTGKSHLLKHLIGSIKEKFVYIPNDSIAILSDPSFFGFAVEHLNNCTLIIEDAEEILQDRRNGNSAAATILNITDGIVGDLLSIKIIATINIKENIDQALLRKGRLLAKVDFKPLPVEKANNVLKRLGKDHSLFVDKPTVLADLYNIDKQTGHQVEERKVGFGNRN